jgi:Bacterial membrane protein YfhO
MAIWGRPPLPRALVARPHLAAALLLALLVLAYLWPVLVGGSMLGPLADLYGYAPFVAQTPRGASHWVNPLLTDVPLAHYPWHVFARQQLHAGTFPAWNPHVLGGVPFFANPQMMLLTPFSLPFWVLPLNAGMGWSAALTLWAAAFGTYLLVRELRLGFLPGLLAGTAYALCSFHVVWLTHGSLPAVSALLPWTLWLVERVLRAGRLGAAIGLALATGIAVTGGHPGTQLHVLSATGLYALVRALALPPEVTAGVRARRLALAGGAIVAGLLLVAVMFLPELHSSSGTLGTQARAGGTGGEPGTRMPFAAIRSVLFPDWWGRPSGVGTFGPAFLEDTGAVEVTFNERTFYPGVVAFLLAVVALVTRGGWRRKGPFALLGAVALAVPLHGPGVYQLAEHLPALKLVQNQRMHVVFELAVAVLGAFGLEAVLRRRQGERRQWVAPAVGIGVALIALVSLGPSGHDLSQVWHHFRTGADVRGGHALALTSIAWLALVSAGVGVLLLGARRWPRRVALAGALVVLLAAGDMLHFAHGYQPMAPASKAIPRPTPAIAWLRRHVGDARIMGMGGALPNDWSLVYGFDDVRGYDPPFPTLRFFHLWRTANPEQGTWEAFRMSRVDATALGVLSVLRARYVVAPPGYVSLSPPGVRLRALRLVYDGADAAIFANDHSPPRALVPRSVAVVPGEDAARRAVTEARFDPRRSAVVERPETGTAALPPAHGTATVTAEQNSRVTLRARLDRPGLVVLNDALMDGWTVTVDGHAAPALHVDDLMRGVVVPAGTHRVVWRYSVPGLRLGAILSLLTLLALLAVTTTLTLRSRRTPAR